MKIRAVSMTALRSMQRKQEMSAAFDKKLPVSQWNDADFIGRVSRAQKRRKEASELEAIQAARPSKPPGRH